MLNRRSRCWPCGISFWSKSHAYVTETFCATPGPPSPLCQIYPPCGGLTVTTPVPIPLRNGGSRVRCAESDPMSAIRGRPGAPPLGVRGPGRPSTGPYGNKGGLSTAPARLPLGGRPAIRERIGRRVAFFSSDGPAAPLAAPFGGRAGAAGNGGHVRARRGITGIPGRSRVILAVDVIRVARGARPARVVPRVRAVRILARPRVLRVPGLPRVLRGVTPGERVVRVPGLPVARVRFVLVAGGQRVAAVHPGLFVLVPAARLAAVPPAGLATVPAGLAPVPAGRAAVAVAPPGVVLVPAVGASSPVLVGLAFAVRLGGGLCAASLDRVVLVIRGRFLTVGARVPRVRVTGVGFWPGLARMPAALIGPALLLRGAPCVPRAPGVA